MVMQDFSTRRHQRPDRANVLDVGISAVDMAQAIRECDELIMREDRGYVCVTGVHGVMEAQRDPEFRDILNRSFLSVPDGMPTVWVGRLQGHRRMRRVYGPDFMLGFCRHSVERGYRHFLYGGNESVAAELALSLRKRFPGLQVVGTFTPPFRALNEAEEQELTRIIGDCKPDVVWVGLSTPKQERFMARYLGRLDTKLMVGVGAAFDVHTGRMKDAPAWIKAAGLQWLHRLAQEPRRLAKRYLVNNPKFVIRILLQFAGLQSHKSVTPDSRAKEHVPMSVKKALVCGAGGFIGSHLVQNLKKDGYWVRGVDLKYPDFSPTAADDFVVADLRERQSWEQILDVPFDEAYQLAADMGGAGYIFTGDHDSHVMHNSAMINLHMADFAVRKHVKKVFYSSSACMYPAYNQEDATTRNAASRPPIRRRPIASTAGRSSSVSGSILPFQKSRSGCARCPVP